MLKRTELSIQGVYDGLGSRIWVAEDGQGFSRAYAMVSTQLFFAIPPCVVNEPVHSFWNTNSSMTRVYKAALGRAKEFDIEGVTYFKTMVCQDRFKFWMYTAIGR